MNEGLNANDVRKERRGGVMERHRVHVGVALLALVVIGAAAGDVVAADRTVLMEYFNATW
jgi:hypothetical protein